MVNKKPTNCWGYKHNAAPLNFTISADIQSNLMCQYYW